MDNQTYQIVRMNQEEVNRAVDWAAKEGWNPGLHDAHCFYKTDPQGFFAGKLNGTIIAVGSAFIYDEHFAFCGLYIVDKKYRDKGYGIELTKARLAYLGSRNAGIDGVMEMLDKYHQLGYEFAHNNARYSAKQLHFNIKPNPHITPTAQTDFNQLCAFDRVHFPANRPNFLKHWIEQKDSLSLCYIDNNQIQGFGLIRTCLHGLKIGPLFATTPEIADTLFQHLAQYAQGKEIFLDIPENNPWAVALTERYRMTKVFATARMYLKEQPLLLIKQIYGITTFELG